MLGGVTFYVNISGDFSVEDRGIDLGVGLSLYGALRNVAARDGVMPIAEVGLGGDLRPCFQPAQANRTWRPHGIQGVHYQR